MKFSEITLQNLSSLTNKELIGWHNRIHAIYSVTKNKDKIKSLVAKHLLMVTAMSEKKIKHNSPISLPISEEVVSILKGLPEDIVFVSDYFCLTGSAVKKLDPKNINWVYKADKKDESLEILINKNILGTDLTSNFISNTKGSHDDYIPVYDLVLRKKSQLVINRIAKDEKIIVKKEPSEKDIVSTISEHTKLHKMSEQSKDKGEIRKLIMQHAVVAEKLIKMEIAHSSPLVYKIEYENIEAPKPSITWLYNDASGAKQIWKTWWENGCIATALNIEARGGGERCICKKSNGNIELYFEEPKEYRTGEFSELKKELEKIESDFILDCDLSSDGKVCSVFDAEYIGCNIAELKYSERKGKIADLFSKHNFSILKLGESDKVKSKEAFVGTVSGLRKIQGNNYIVAKSDSAYPSDNITSEWLKIKKAADITVKVISKEKVDGKYNYAVGINSASGIKEICKICDADVNANIGDNLSLFTDCIAANYTDEGLDINFISPTIEKRVFKNVMSENDVVLAGIKNYIFKSNVKREDSPFGKDLSVLKSRHSYDKCMECGSVPDYEIIWAEGWGHAWFCKKHLKIWESEGNGWHEVCAIKEVKDGKASKKYSENTNPDLIKSLSAILKQLTTENASAIVPEKGPRPQRKRYCYCPSCRYRLEVRAKENCSDRICPKCGAKMVVKSEEDISKPYPNEHAARLNDPDKYAKIRRENNKFGEGIHVIWGIISEGKTEIQAIRFDKNKFTEAEAKAWLKEHKHTPILFEPAVAKMISPPSGFVPIKKIDKMQHIVYGIVLQPEIEDSQGHTASAEEIEIACHGYMERGYKINIDHGEEDFTDEIRVIENTILRQDEYWGDELVKKGSWVMAVKVNNLSAWQAVLDGELDGFSIEGIARVEPY